MPLRIIIVGGGLVGLATATALRKGGHDIVIFEQSRFSNEVGAAAHLAPNAVRVLEDMGVNKELLRGAECYGLRVIFHEDPWVKYIMSVDTGALELAIGRKMTWLLSHRADIHGALREAATAVRDGLPGKPAELRLRSEVVSVNPAKAEVTLKDGTVERGDLVIGADGIYSAGRSAIIGKPTELISTGQNCFRFMIPRQNVMENPKTRSFLAAMSPYTADAHIDLKTNCKFMVYPCRDGQLLNFAVVHPSQDTNDVPLSAGWLAPGSYEDLVKVTGGFSKQIRDLCEMAEDIKLWSFATIDPPATLFKEKLVLVGDAAHHMLPHQGQGAAQGMEDGAALGVLLDDSATPENLPARLAAYNDLRFRRTVTWSILGRVDDLRKESMLPTLRQRFPDAECPPDMVKAAWEYDVLGAARERLGKLKEEAQ